MNFTREPIIETIISPREGCKLLVRSSKGGAESEEYYVDAIEVVSFGRAFFFRSLERPKAFLVPVSDYEVLEVKETRVALKNVSHERNIKIGGGRDAPMRHREQPPQEREPEAAAEGEEEQPSEAHEAPAGSRMEKRRDRRRRRHRRGSDEQEWQDRRMHEPKPEGEAKAGGEDEAKATPQSFPSLIPPPSTLISETISRYKEKESTDGAQPPKEVDEKKNHDDDRGDSAPLHRTETVEVSSFTATFFSPLNGGNDRFTF